MRDESTSGRPQATSMARLISCRQSASSVRPITRREESSNHEMFSEPDQLRSSKPIASGVTVTNPRWVSSTA